METIYMLCPTTRQLVNTGIQMTAEAFQTWTYTGAGMPCPHCGETHVWSKQDARLGRTVER